MSGWQAGDRVEVFLPDRDGTVGRKGASHWYAGTIREVDPPSHPPGVLIDLDEVVNGVSNCYATHAELRPEVTSGG